MGHRLCSASMLTTSRTGMTDEYTEAAKDAGREADPDSGEYDVEGLEVCVGRS